MPYDWLQPCLDSVQDWAKSRHYDYRFTGDDFFDPVPDDILAKTQMQKVIATDLARLYLIRHYLRSGYETVVWCDADFLIFKPKHFILLNAPYALGREHWIQTDKTNRLRCYTKVHNAFMLYRQGNSFLDFYIDSALKLIRLNSGTMPPQFIGPKLLTALCNIVQCPIMENAGMFSPLVLRDLVRGGGEALNLFGQHNQEPIAAANLSASLASASTLNASQMYALIEQLIRNQGIE